MMGSQSHADIVEQFSGLSLPHMNGLYGLAFQLTRDRAKAEDLVQETYLKGFERFEQFRTGTNFKAWIFTILRNTFINQYHKNKLRRSLPLDSVEPTLKTPCSADALCSSIDVRSAPFRAALATLSEDSRTMLFLAYVEEFTYREIAQVMNCPMGTVMSRLFRARRRVRRQLQEARGASMSGTPTAAA